MTWKATRPHPRGRGRLLWTAVGVMLAITAFWADALGTPQPSGGKDVFRFDTFGNETFWTDTLRLHETISNVVDPTTALSVGLEVDADALPPGILKTADLKSPATTVALKSERVARIAAQAAGHSRARHAACCLTHRRGPDLCGPEGRPDGIL